MSTLGAVRAWNAAVSSVLKSWFGIQCRCIIALVCRTVCVEQFSAGKYLHLGPEWMDRSQCHSTISQTYIFRSSSAGGLKMLLLYVVSSLQVWLNSFPFHCQTLSVIRWISRLTEVFHGAAFPIQGHEHFEKSFFYYYEQQTFQDHI